jgi:aspartate-semialdehyde dehydrogenase
MKKKSKYNIAVVGATGAVGEELLKVLERRKFPVAGIRMLASSRSAGRRLPFGGKEYPVEELKSGSFSGIDIALFSAGGRISLEFCPVAVESGAVVIDNSSAFRMEPRVPLVVPEINPQDIKTHRGIVANPNCSTIIAAMAVWPIHRIARVKRMVVVTYQAVSGAGAKAIEELKNQTGEFLQGLPLTRKIFRHQIAFNLFSHDSPIGAEGYSAEEIKIVRETRKIFHDSKIAISTTAIRVPVFRAHAEAIHLELARSVAVSEARKALASMPGIVVIDDREQNIFPMPIEVSGRDEVFVGRIRQDLHLEEGLNLFVCGDQLLKGAALNAVQIAEKVIE